MPKRILPGALMLIATGGCAFDVIHVDHTPARLDTASAPCTAPITLSTDVTVTPSGGYARTLKRGTRWECRGRIDQGWVYRTRDQVLTLEASNVFEADIVVLDGTLTGFYLPVERAYSALSPTVELPAQ